MNQGNNWLAVGLLCAGAFVAVFALAVKTGALPITCEPPRHVISFRALDGFRTEECVPPPPPPGTPPAAQPRR